MHPFHRLQVSDRRIGIHWFGQNSFALKDARGTVVLTDPYFPHGRPPERFIYRTPPLDEAALRPDAVVLTHDHGDHTCVESLLRIRQAHPQTVYVGPVESIERLIGVGFPEDVLMVARAGAALALDDVMLHAVWSKPPDGVPDDGIRPPRVQHLGYVLEIGGIRLYLTGDLINTFADHDELMAPVAALAPEVGLLTMHPTEGEFPYFEGAVKMAVDLGLKAAVPAHYACFVKRTYDPTVWARMLPSDGPRPLIIGYDRSVVYAG